MQLICIKQVDGFTVGKQYALQGCAGEHVQLIDDCGQAAVLLESYFDIAQ